MTHPHLPQTLAAAHYLATSGRFAPAAQSKCGSCPRRATAGCGMTAPGSAISGAPHGGGGHPHGGGGGGGGHPHGGGGHGHPHPHPFPGGGGGWGWGPTLYVEPTTEYVAVPVPVAVDQDYQVALSYARALLAGDAQASVNARQLIANAKAGDASARRVIAHFPAALAAAKQDLLAKAAAAGNIAIMGGIPYYKRWTGRTWEWSAV